MSASNCGVVAKADNGATINQYVNCFHQTERDARAEAARTQRMESAATETRTNVRSIKELLTQLLTQQESTQADADKAQKLAQEIEAARTSLQGAEARLEAQEQERDEAKAHAEELRGQLSSLGAALLRAEHDRVTPIALDWAAFATAAVGCGVAIAAEVAGSNVRAELRATLRSDAPELTLEQSRDRAARLEDINLVGKVGLLAWALGSVVAARYIYDLTRAAIPLPEAIHIDVGHTHFGLQASGKWNAM
jgi:DNA repair exonuclease SbcCD ATPase subunit